MLIILLCLILVIVGVILTIKFTDEVPGIAGCVVAVFFGVVLLAEVIDCIVANSPTSASTVRIKYTENVAHLTATYNMIMTYDQPDYARYTAIQQYNAEVAEFKSEILGNQRLLKNPWVNWFNCYQWNNCDANAVSYINV